MAAVFQSGNKGRRRNHASFGMDPANQGLRGNQIPTDRLYYRLIVDLKFPVCNGRLILAHKLHLVHIHPPHGVIKYGIGLQMVRQHAFLRQLGPVDHADHGNLVILQIIHAAAAVKLHASVFQLDIHGQVPEHRIHTDVVLGKQTDKMVRLQPGRNGGIPDSFHAVVEIPQDIVPASDAEELIGGLEVLNIKEHQGIVRLFRGIVQNVLCHADKPGTVIAAGETVFIFMLIQRQDVVNSVEYDFRAEGLCKKVHRTQLVGVENGGIGGLSGNDDHGQVPQQLHFLHLLQNAKAVDSRHLDVQQHQMVQPLLGLNHLNGLRTVFSLIYLVLVPQNIGKQLPVDGNVVYN